MREEEENPNSIYVPCDLLKEIFLRLSLKSLIKLKIVSKEWRSILESKTFVDMHLNCQKSGTSRRRKILADCLCDCGAPPRLLRRVRFIGDEEVVYLHSGVKGRSMSCDGLVCVPEPGWFNVLNPATGQLWRFSSGLDLNEHLFPRIWAMGFGRDKVSGSYKIVMMCFGLNLFEILDVNIGEWRKLSPPPHPVSESSACVNGSIYWSEYASSVWKIQALDLHTEEFHDVPIPPILRFKLNDIRILNLEDRLALVTAREYGDSECKLEIWTMDEEKETWSLTYSVSLDNLPIKPWEATSCLTPVKISNQGNVLIYDKRNMLFKYYPHPNIVCRIFPHSCIILSPYLETLFRPHTDQVDLETQSSCIGIKYCAYKDETAPAHAISSFQLRVDKFLCIEKELGTLLWRNKMKILATCFVVHLVFCFCCFCASLLKDDFFKFIVMIILTKLVMSMSFSFLIVGVLLSAFTAILTLVAVRALIRRLLHVVSFFFQDLIG